MTPLLSRWGQLDFAEFRSKLAVLTDQTLDAIAAATPAEWCAGPAQSMLKTVVETLRGRRDAVDTWLPEVEEWLKTR